MKEAENMGESFDAIAAILFYAHDAMEHDNLPDPFTDEDRIIYATAHQVQGGKLQAGMPLSQRHIERMIREMSRASARRATVQFNEEEGSGYLIPDNLVYFSEFVNIMMWWKPAGREMIFFSKDSRIPSGKANLPPLLFCYCCGGLVVFALKENAKPSLQSEVYATPFFNGGCMGNVRLPSFARPGHCAHIERLFFESEFTFAEGPTLEDGFTGESLWKSLLGTDTIFPLECLSKRGSLGNFVTKLRRVL